MFKQSSAPLSDVRISFTSSDHDDNCFNNCYDLLVEHQNFVRSATIEAKSAIYEYLDLMLINGDSSISQETISQEMLETIKGSDDILVFLKGLYVSLSIKYASDRIRNDPWLVLRASRFDTESINFASTKLKLNRDFAIKAIEINPTAIKYLPNFADDYEIGLSCVKENGLTLNYLSNNLKSNTTIILEAIQSDGKAFDFMPDHLKTRELLERAIATSSDVPKFPAEFNSDPSFILKYIRRNSHFYSSDIDENLFDNEDFCLQVSQFGIYWDNIKDLPSVFVNEELMLEIIATDAHHIETISELVDEEFCFLAVQLQPECLDYIDLSQFDRNTFMDLLTNTEICEKIISLDDFKDDREFVLKSIRVSNLTMLMSYVSETIKSDRNIIIEALVKCPFSLESMLEETKEDQEIIDIALFRNSEVLHFISQKFLDDIDYCLKSVQNSSSPEFNDVFIGLSETREEVLQLIKNIPHFSIDGVPRNLLLDREIVSLILQERGYQFKYLPKTLKSDRELVLIGVRNRLLLNLVLPKFRHDREIVIEAVKSSGLNLGYVPEQFQDDEEIVFLSCLHPGFSSGLMFASKRLRGDKNFMSKVLALHGYHLQYASTNLKQDKDIVKIAIETGEDCFAYASYELRMDRELVLLAINKNSGAVRYITSDELLKDREIIEVAFRESTNLLKYLNWENMIDLDFLLKTECKEFILRSIPYRFRHGKSIIQKAIMSTPNSLLYVTELEYQKELRNNRIVMLNAIKSKPNLFPYCSQELIQNEDFILDALRVNGLVLQYLPLGHICNREIVKIAVLQNGESLEHASNELRMDSEIVLVAVQQNGSALRFTSPKLKNDKKIVLEAVKSNAKAFEFASFELRTDQSFVMEVIEINIESLHNAHYSLRYNIEFLRKINKDNRLVENTSIELKKVIDLNGLLGYEPLLTIHLFGNVNKRKVNSDLKLFNRSPEVIEKRLVQLNYYFKQLCKNRKDIFNKLGTLAFVLKFIKIPNELEQYIKVKDDQLKSTDTEFLNSHDNSPPPFYRIIFRQGLKYKLVKFIGNGAFGSVFHCVDEDGREYAIKEIPALYVDTTYVENNAKLISECNETFLRYILRILDSFQIGSQYYVITEYFNKGSLINIRNDLKMSVSTILQIIVQIVTSLRFLNSKKMVHLDIKEGNIFVQSFNGHRILLILGDLGLCRKVNPSMQSSNNTTNSNDNKNKNVEISNESLFGSLSSSESIGTPFYQAPEIVQQENSFIHEKSDIYSLGCTILYYLFGKNEVLDVETKLDWRKINSLFQKLEEKEPEWKYINELLQKMLAIDVKERADTKTILDFIFKQEVSTETSQLMDENIDLLTNYVKLQDYFKTSDSIIRNSLFENGNQFEHLPEQFKNNEDYFHIAAQQSSLLYHKSGQDQVELHLSIADQLKPGHNEITILKKDSSEQNRNDYYFALGSVSMKGETLRFVGHDLKMNRKIVMAAVKQNPMAIKYAPISLRKDKEIAKKALYYNGKVLEHLADLQDDEEIVLAAVSVHGTALKFASPRLRSQENIIRLAVKVDGLAIEYADTSKLSFKSLFEIVCENFEACEHLKCDKKLVMDYVKKTNDDNAKTYLVLSEKKVSISKMIQLADNGNALAQLYCSLEKPDDDSSLQRMLNSANQDNILAKYTCARLLYNSGQSDMAITWLQDCASKSYLPAIIALCSLVNPATNDYKWYLKAAHFGHSEIQFEYGLSIFRPDDDSTQINYQGFYWCKQSARQGFPKAQYYISHCYKYGFGVSRNPEKVFKWTKLAAENDVTMAQQQLGLLYRDGEGTEQDFKQALHWLEISAKKKNWISLNEIGVLYMEGIGVKVNYDKAIEYFQKSLQTLEEYNNTPNTEDSDEKFLSPPKGKGEYIYLYIGQCYYHKKKYDEGIKWMVKSARLGCTDAAEVLRDYTGMIVSTSNDDVEEVKYGKDVILSLN